ncbi:MAG: hypothetical protein WA908_01410 [Pontixanthobacter sp.]
MDLQTILNLLPKVGPIIAAAPEFKALIEQILASFDSDADQETLKEAYRLAVSNAREAHTELQAIVAQHS